MKRITWLILAGFVLAITGRISVARPGIGLTDYYSDYPAPGCTFATLDSHTKPKKIPCYCGLFHTWSVEHNGCVGLVNTSCALGRLCNANSYCDRDDWCQCTSPYVATRSRTCILNLSSLIPLNKTIDLDTKIRRVPTKDVLVTSNEIFAKAASTHTVVRTSETPMRSCYCSTAASPCSIFKFSTLAIVVLLLISFV